MKKIKGHFWYPVQPVKPVQPVPSNSRASRARRVDIFEPRRDIVGMEQKSVEAVTFQMLALIQALILSP